MFLAKKIFCILIFFLFSLSSTVSANENNQIILKAVGDIMCHDIQYITSYRYDIKDYDFVPAFSKVKKHLDCDLLIGNLETTFSGAELGYSGYPRFNTPDALGKALKELGFGILFTANNHSLDKGEYGLKRTIDVLDNLEILHTGTFRDEAASEKHLITNIKGIHLGFLNYTYGTNGLKLSSDKDCLINYIDEEKIRQDIREIRPLVDLVVVGLHFGNEYWQKPSSAQKDLAYNLAEFGADIILGGHAHVLQPYEIIDTSNNQCFVVYSLGNFISAQKGRYKDSGAILNLTIDNLSYNKKPKISQIDYTPIWVRRYKPEGKLKFELIPYPYNNISDKLSYLEEEKLLQVKNDVENIWQPIYGRESSKDKIYFIKEELPLTNPFSWII